jgi:TP901 family phage tail tape measure protein
MSASDIRAGRAFVELTTKDTALEKGLRAAQARLRTFGASIDNAGRKLLAMGALSAAPLAASIATYASFEAAMARVRALTNASADDFARLNNEAKRLGVETVFTSKDAADAMAFFALAGFKVDEMLKATGPTLDMAAAGQLGIAEAADITAKIMRGMGIEAENVGYAVDVLTKAMTTANTDLRQLGDAMKYVGPVAKTAGVDIETTVAAVQLLSDAGIQADMAGTTLRGALLSLTDPSKEAAELMKDLEISARDAQGNLRPLADIIDDFNRATEGMGTADRLGVIGKIFDARQAAGFAMMMDKGGNALRRNTSALHDSAGTAERIARIQLDTVAGDWKLLLSAIEGVALAIGEALAPAVRTAATAITDITRGLANWIANNKQTAAYAAFVVGGVLAVGIAFIAVGTAIKLAAGAMAGFGAILTAFKATVSTVATVLLSLANPIVLVSALLIAGGAAFLYFSGIGGQVVDWLKTKFGQLAAFFGETVSGMADALAAGDIELAAKILWASLKVLWQEGVSALTTPWQTFTMYLVKAWIWVTSKFKLAITTFSHFFKSIWIELSHFASRIWEGVIDTVANAIIDVWALFDETIANSKVEIQAKLADENRRQTQQIENQYRNDSANNSAEFKQEADAVSREYGELMYGAELARNENIKAAQDELARLRQERQALLDQARNKKPGFDTLEAIGPKAPEAPKPPTIEAVQAQAEALSSRGTFSGREASQALRAAGGLQKLIKASEKTARFTEQTADNTAGMTPATFTN